MCDSSNPISSWLAGLQQHLAAAVDACESVATAMAGMPPAATTADIDALLAFRRSRGLADAPANAEAIRDAASSISSGIQHAGQRLGESAVDMLSAADRYIITAGRQAGTVIVASDYPGQFGLFAFTGMEAMT